MTITNAELRAFHKELVETEMAASTVTRYMSVARAFAAWLGTRELTKDMLLAWRAELERSPSTVNVATAALNRLMHSLGRGDLRLRQMKTQQRAYRPTDRELTEEEYRRLVCTAERQGSRRLARAIETICVLGIRVSELRYITVGSLERREITITNKGKTRTILMTSALAKKLNAYCRREGIAAGPVFVTRTGRPLSRTQLWAEMKSLCEAAGVEPSKVFPHNLRHLFAVTFYRRHRDVMRLADLLGHSSVNTTRIYLLTSSAELRREMEDMELLLPGAA